MELNKIVFSDGATYSSVAAPYELDAPIFSRVLWLAGERRDTLRITVAAAYADIAAAFVPGAVWAIRQYDITPEGVELETYTDYDKSDYTVCGDIVDHRDGRVTVYMGKPTETELLREALNESMLQLHSANLLDESKLSAAIERGWVKEPEQIIIIDKPIKREV